MKRCIGVLLALWIPLLLSGEQSPNQASTRSPHGSLSLPCQSCHTSMSWKPIRAMPDFDHNKTRYPLRGMHASIGSCTQCHTKLIFTDVGHSCADCHADIHRGQLGASCQECHSVKGWQVSIQDIKQHQNRFPLIGAHAALSCDACHTGAATGQFAGLDTSCISCHTPDFQKTNNPSHVALNFPSDCQQCHSMNSWLGAQFDHTKFTNFPLTGVHARLDCSQCHAGGNFTNAPSTCAGCHLTDFNGTNNPNHRAAGFSQDCATCHNTTSWLNATFNHNTQTKFPLTGAHATVQCSQCHAPGALFASAPTQCVGCHLGNFQSTTNPNHVAAGFPQTCEQCHNTVSWLNANFDHSKTAFPLTGAHTSVQCSQCHTSSNFAAAPTQCVGCHLASFQSTTNPNHVTAGFPQTCETCHNTTSWLNANFDHSKTAFPLTGAHTTVQCSQCHTSSNFAAAPTQCVGCHLTSFQSATNPPHVSGGFPQTCEQCHTTASWLTSTFNHTSMTRFPLTGAHAALQCSQCHSSGVFSAAPTQCAACHLTTFQQTTNPNHVAAGFPTDCSICHSTTNWLGAVFDHSKTPFPLTGAHVGLSCNSCHASGVFVGLSTACVSCHLSAFQGTTNPNHVTSGFPQDCSLCHSTANWTSSTFNHNNTPFPLTGAHTTVACTSCHVNGNFTTTPTDCYSCHKSLYTSTTNPNHVAAGFPTTCQTCHNTTAWTGATFNHTWFPIFSGTHNQSVWVTCSACHANSANYSSFTCIACHTHTQAATDPHHGGVRGYVYAPTTCYSCHKS